MIIVPGSGSRSLAFKIAKAAGFDIVDVEVRSFPDREIYVKLKGRVKGEEVALIQSMAREPNKLLVEFLLTVDALRSSGARRVIGVIPYFPYLRQDAIFEEGEALSAKVVSKVIGGSGIDEVITVDPHLHRIKDLSGYLGVKFEKLTAASLLANYFKGKVDPREVLVIAPDEEAEQWAKPFAEELGTDYEVLIKSRKTPSEVELKAEELSVKGEEIIIVDDMISTGTTMAEAVKALKLKGARRIFATCTHPLLIGDALYRIYRAGADEVVGTDTVPSPVSLISVAPLIADFLKNL